MPCSLQIATCPLLLAILGGALTVCSWGLCGGQTARYLVKQLLAARAGKPVAAGSAEYTRDAEASLAERCAAASSRDWLDHGTQSAAFRCPGLRLCPIGLALPSVVLPSLLGADMPARHHVSACWVHG